MPESKQTLSTNQIDVINKRYRLNSEGELERCYERLGWRKIVTKYNAKSKSKKYPHCEIDKQPIYYHIIVIYLATGQQPEEIDHIDHDLNNFKLSNLRPANRVQNRLNQPEPKNATGYRNVYPYEYGYFVQFTYKTKTHRVFSFSTSEEAARAADDLKRKIIAPEDMAFARFNFEETK